MRSEHLRNLFASALCVLAAFALVHLGASALARWAEGCLGAHLWWQEEQLSLLEPGLYGRGSRPRLYIYGPSVTREAVIEAEFEERLPGLCVRNESHSLTTRSDVLRYLELLERARGPGAFPEHLVLTWTPRMLADIGADGSALGGAIERYSPGFRRAAPGAATALEPKTAWESLASRWRALLHGRKRYKQAVRALAVVLRTRPLDLSCRSRDLGPPLRRSTYRHLTPLSEARVAEILSGLSGFWRRGHRFDFAAAREPILADLHRIREICARHGVMLYVVTMPERSGYRALYAPGVYEGFRALLDEGFAGVPRLDLRELLADDRFYDHCHANGLGAREVSRAIAGLVGEKIGI